MHCGGCGYENPIDLARCPRCGVSEQTLAERGPVDNSQTERWERTQEHLTLATRVGPPPAPLPHPSAREQLQAAHPRPWHLQRIAPAVAFLVGITLGPALLWAFGGAASRPAAPSAVARPAM